MKLTSTKLTIAGSIIEARHYMTKPLAYGFTVSPNSKARRKIVVMDQNSEIRKLESKKRSMRRARSNIRKLVNANAWQWKNEEGVPYAPMLITLTFKDDIRNIKIANAYFSRFIRCLNRNASSRCGLKYVAVVEFQDTNRSSVIHYHVVFFNLITNDAAFISKAWPHGFVDQREVYESDNVGIYISKNLFLVNSNDRLDNRKHYFSSRGLLHPIEIRDQNKAKAIIGLIPKEYIEKEDIFDGYQGIVKTVSYKLNNDENLFNILPELSNLL